VNCVTHCAISRRAAKEAGWRAHEIIIDERNSQPASASRRVVNQREE
jgi:hypothetical protein